MAFNVSNLTEYTKPANEIFQANVLFTDNFQNYHFQNDVNYKTYVEYLDTSITISSTACGTTPAGTETFYEKVLQVGNYNIETRICEDDLSKYAIYDLDWETPLIENWTKKITEAVNSNMWVGTISGSADPIDGLVTQAIADGSVVTVSKTAPASGTIINRVNEIIAGLNDAAYTSKVSTIHTDRTYFEMYRQALIAGAYTYGTYNHPEELGANEMWVFGQEGKVKIKLEPGFTASSSCRMFLTPDDNIHIGTNEMIRPADAVKIVYDHLDWVYFRAKFKFGVTYRVSADVVILADA